MLAMQDALDERKFNLFLTLIAKTAEDSIVQQLNEKGQNLMHILAMNASQATSQVKIIERIFETLKKRGVDIKDDDLSGSNALHYAVISNSIEVCRLLIYNGIDQNKVNDEGHSPLSLALKGQPIVLDRESVSLHKPIWYLLLEAGADPNHVYPETSHNKKKSKAEMKSDRQAAADRKSGETGDRQLLDQDSAAEQQEPLYTCSIMINYLRHNKQEKDVLLQSIKTLVFFKANFAQTDSLGRNVLHYAIINNNQTMFDFILANKDEYKLDTSCRDINGFNAVHTVIRPHPFGSYNNSAMLAKLISLNNFSASETDSNGRTPLDLAMEFDDTTMASELGRLLGVVNPLA